MVEQHIYQTIKNYVPENSVHYCYDLWKNHPFELKISRARSSKLGDYRFDYRDKSESISVNRNLNPYAFLITYLHEVAHLKAYHSYGRKISPHGKEWKRTFSDLLEPVISDLVFPEEVLEAIRNYQKSPKATSGGDHALALALNRINGDEGKLLAELEEGSLFKLGKKIFRKENLRRTRYLCEEVKSGRKYLVSRNAVVHGISKP